MDISVNDGNLPASLLDRVHAKLSLRDIVPVGLDLSAGLSNQLTASLAAMPMWPQRIGRGCTQIRLLVLQDFHQQSAHKLPKFGFSKSFRGGTDDFWHSQRPRSTPPSHHHLRLQEMLLPLCGPQVCRVTSESTLRKLDKSASRSTALVLVAARF